METRSKIIEAAKAIFSEKGYFKAKMDEIAERAGVAKGSIYTYFSSKADLFFSLIVEGLETIGKEIEEILRSKVEPVSKIDRVLEVYLETFTKHREFITTLLLERRIFEKDKEIEARARIIKKKLRNIIESLKKIMEEGIRKGIFKELDPLVMSLSLLGMCNRVLMYYVVEEVDFKPELIKKNLKRIFLTGVIREGKYVD